MALATYTDLQASIANWLHRNDLAAVIPDFITLAEKRINGDLDARLQDTVATLATVAGVLSVATPADVVNIRSLTIQASPNQVLNYLTPDQFNEQYAFGESGTPRSFTMIGGAIYLGPTPDAAYALQTIYKALVPSLGSAVGGVNWLMTNYPQVYLMAALCESAPYVVGDDRLPLWEQKYKEAIESVNSVDWYSGSTMRVRGDMRL